MINFSFCSLMISMKYLLHPTFLGGLPFSRHFRYLEASAQEKQTFKGISITGLKLYSLVGEVALFRLRQVSSEGSK